MKESLFLPVLVLYLAFVATFLLDWTKDFQEFFQQLLQQGLEAVQLRAALSLELS